MWRTRERWLKRLTDMYRKTTSRDRKVDKLQKIYIGRNIARQTNIERERARELRLFLPGRWAED